ncbi:hypothetical protein EYC84_010296 [Monilinia fructicola]|uniref:Uncharacterized protein n=1 Tax=Monilinia fructicola TaxID=38448 RepID=A0A5M9JDB9_MONFR|nr:hypothetical protein EYC84_010296 [Monilinia fructicola]
MGSQKTIELIFSSLSIIKLFAMADCSPHGSIVHSSCLSKSIHASLQSHTQSCNASVSTHSIPSHPQPSYES